VTVRRAAAGDAVACTASAGSPAALQWALRPHARTLSLPSGRAQVFQADRGAFAALPQWRQAQAKRAAGLF